MVLGKVLAMNYHNLEARSGPPRAKNYTQVLISRGIMKGALHMCPPPIFEGNRVASPLEPPPTIRAGKHAGSHEEACCRPQGQASQEAKPCLAR